MEILIQNAQSAAASAGKPAHPVCNNETWVVDDVIMSAPATGRNAQKRLLVVSVLDCSSDMVICAKSFSLDDHAVEAASGILRGLTDDYGWPKCFCCDAGIFLHRVLTSLLARERNKSTFIRVLHRYALSRYRHTLEAYFWTLEKKPLCIGSQEDLVVEHADPWLEDMRVQFNSRRVTQPGNNT